MPLLDKIGAFLSSGVDKTIDSIGTAFDKNFTNKEELEAAKLLVTQELNRNKEATAKLIIDEHEIDLKNTADARNREVQIATSEKAPLINKIMLPCLAAAVTMGFFGILFYMLRYDVPKENVNVLNIMLGSLGTAWVAVVMYYFGSSSGSAAKSQTIEQMAQR